MGAMLDRPRRALILALLGLTAPLPALAIDGGEEAGGGPATLSVAASLDRCGTADAQILCKIDASWNTIPGADQYAVSVTRADGSVVEYGDGGGAGTALWVPYVGSGSYAVQVAAYGTPVDDEKPEVLAKDKAKPVQSEQGGVAAAKAPEADSGEAAEEAPGAVDGEEVPADGGGEPSGDDGESPAPACEEPPAELPVNEDPAGEEPAEPVEDLAVALEDISAATEAALAAEGELPDSLACPTAP